MSVDVYIPTPFRRATSNKDRVTVDAADVKTLLDELEEQYSGLRGLVRNERGEVHDHVNIYVNNEGIDALQGLETVLKDGDEVSIIPALAGGTGPICVAILRYSVARDAQRTESTPRVAGSLVPRLARNLTQYPGQVTHYRQGGARPAGGPPVDQS